MYAANSVIELGSILDHAKYAEQKSKKGKMILEESQ